ncbi:MULTISPECIES: glycosyltransferase [Brevibacterium]|jgi:UDP-N-acetylglucosamine--N-acetylmuramyl-(pentapeptide) pyrophosphoryl-undecaprenol N-acetylglucosamine transferase|uniref:UDP-N-acetylglucosamine--N-acetylmuramyl- (pentapeptide) pyrophosphoryl-undecaprenol N-acetylglucosamine transferase n=1 Tax=Brevibacterium TaxID=1696 RepID=UPI001BAB7E04|nr:UDP-N-acetylglucosamine--N-acetylmuramyl-(pentapeptide) pyrophosphoryl-undecaprenol N-acetylglucosamine transferase [Brevibacterium sp. W7.2]
MSILSSARHDGHISTSSADRPRTIAIAAGGTGGHIYPGLAVADELRARGHHVIFFGSDDRMENRIVPARGYHLETSRIHGLTGPRSALTLPGTLSAAVMRSARALRRAGVEAVLGTGGYPSMPALIAARLLGLPALVHESNCVPGLANRTAARLGAEVAVSSTAAARGFAAVSRTAGQRAAAITGMPIDPALVGLDRRSLRTRARKQLGVPESGVLVLVSGGSLGAQAVNDAALELGVARNGDPGIHFLIKTGAAAARDVDSTAVTTVDYLSRMDLAYAAADLIVARAGASTVAELEHLGLPAVLVPLTTSAGGHQQANADHLRSQGLADVIAEDELSPSRLDAAITDLLARTGELRNRDRGEAAGGTADSIHARAAATLADSLLALLPAPRR